MKTDITLREFFEENNDEIIESVENTLSEYYDLSKFLERKIVDGTEGGEDGSLFMSLYPEHTHFANIGDVEISIDVLVEDCEEPTVIGGRFFRNDEDLENTYFGFMYREK